MCENRAAFASDEEINAIEEKYKGRKVYHGEMHDHSDSGGTSDGGCTLAEWKKMLADLNMDFAAILDHRQVRHMFLPDFDKNIFVCGSEPGTVITDSRATGKEVHYNMIVPNPETLMAILEDIPECKYEGGPEGHFSYPYYTKERFCEIIDIVKEHGGFFVIPHPKQVTISEYDDDYWYRDGVGMEVFYVDMECSYTKENYPLWIRLLQAGKRIFVCAGCDKHNRASDKALTTIYAEPKSTISEALVPVLCTGDFTCGSVGIRMMAGDTLSGGSCVFNGQRLVIAVGDYHTSVMDPSHKFRFDIFAGEECISSNEVFCDKTSYFSLDMKEDIPYYRTELWDLDRGCRIALGNPVWNDR